MCANTILSFEGLKTKNVNNKHYNLAHTWEKSID